MRRKLKRVLGDARLHPPGPAPPPRSVDAAKCVRPLWSQATVIFLGEYFIPRISNIRLGIRATHKLSQNTLLTASSASFSTVECAGFKYNSETSSCLKKYPEKSSHRENLTLSNLSKWSRYSDNPDRFNSVKRLAGHGADYLIPEESLSRKCYCRSSGSP